MTKKLLAVMMIFALLLPLATAPAVAADEPAEAQQEEEVGLHFGYIVTLARPKGMASAMSVSAALGVDAQPIGYDDYTVADLSDVAKLAENGMIVGVCPNYIRYAFGGLGLNDPKYKYQWNLDHMDVGALWAMNSGTLKGSGVTVAVIDTGLFTYNNGYAATFHEDLPASRIVAGKNFIADNYGVRDSDGNLITDFDNYPKNSTDPNNTSDIKGHGSSCATIIAATANNGKGLAGIAPEVSIMPLQVFQWFKNDNEDATGAADADIMQALNHVTALNTDADPTNDVAVVNMSLGGPKYSDSYNAAIQRTINSGAIVLAAVGNDSNSTKNYPACYDNVIGVGALGTMSSYTLTENYTDAQKNTRASYSNYNSSVDIVAPGSCIFSAKHDTTDGYDCGHGTSFATPAVAALAALAKQNDPTIDQTKFMKLLKMGSVYMDNITGKVTDADNVYTRNDWYGYGRVNGRLLASGMTAQTISYVLDSGENPSGARTSYYRYETSVSLPTPTREGCTFKGWYTDSGFSGSAVSSFVPAASDGERIYYAQWASNSVELSAVTFKTDASAEAKPMTAPTGGSKEYTLELRDVSDLSAATVSATPAVEGTAVTVTRDTDGSNDPLNSWTIDVVSESGTASETYTATVSTSHSPSRTHDESETASVTPASLDGLAAAVGYSETITGWFTDADDDISAYRFANVTVSYTDGGGSTTTENKTAISDVDGLAYDDVTGVLSYTPTAEYAGRTVEFDVRAYDGVSTSEAVHVTFNVAALPISTPTISPDAGSFDKYTDTSGLAVTFVPYDNTFAGLEMNDAAVAGTDYETAGSVVTLKADFIKTLDVGEHTIAFVFTTGREATDNVRRVDFTLTVTDSTPSAEPSEEPSEEPSPSAEPSAEPSEEPSPSPSEPPAESPSPSPSEPPAESPSPSPSEPPAESPSPSPSEPPAESPSPSEPPAESPGPSPSEPPAESPSPSPSPSETPSGGGSRPGGGGGGRPGGGGGGGGAVAVPPSPSPAPEPSPEPGPIMTEVQTGGGAGLLMTLEKDSKLTDEQSKAVVEANISGPVLISTAEKLTVVLPKGVLTENANVADLLPDVTDAKDGDVVVRVDENGVKHPVVMSTVSNGEVAFVVDEAGKYEIVHSEVEYADTTTHWAKNSIEFVSARELFKGTGAGEFSPEQKTTRAMVFVVLGRIGSEGLDAVQGDTWYSSALEWAMSEGLSDGTRPNDNITREELVTLLWRWSGRKDVGPLDGFADKDAVSDWAKRAMAWAAKSGIITGRTDGTIDPAADATRAELAAIVQRFVKYYVGEQTGQ